MADQMMGLSTLRSLDICVLDSNNCSWQLVLPKDSHVQQLTVKGPKYRQPPVFVDIMKPGIQHECCGVQKVFCAKVPKL